MIRLPHPALVRVAFAATLLLTPLLSPAATPATQPSRLDLPSFGISVPVPTGYTRDLDSQSSVAWLLPAGPRPPHPTRILLIDLLGPSSSRPAAAVVRNLADGPHKSTQHPIRWGNEPATELVDQPETAHMVIAEHAGWTYRLIYNLDPAHPADLAPYQTLLAETRWTPTTSAGSGVATRQPFFSLPNGMTLSIPDPFRPVMSDKSQRLTMTFEAFDLPTNSMSATLLVLPLPPKASGTAASAVAETVNDLNQNLAPNMKLKQPLTWQDQAGPVATSLTQRTPIDRGYTRILVAGLPDTTTTAFVLKYDAPESDLPGLERTLDLIKSSIQPTRSTPTRNSTP